MFLFIPPLATYIVRSREEGSPKWTYANFVTRRSADTEIARLKTTNPALVIELHQITQSKQLI